MIYGGPGFLDVVWFGSSPTPLPLPSVSSTGDAQQFAGGRGGGRSQIIRRRESLVLYKSFITLLSSSLADLLWRTSIIKHLFQSRVAFSSRYFQVHFCYYVKSIFDKGAGKTTWLIACTRITTTAQLFFFTNWTWSKLPGLQYITIWPQSFDFGPDSIEHNCYCLSKFIWNLYSTAKSLLPRTQ